MKKILALILALVLALGMVGCGGSSKPAETKPAEEAKPRRGLFGGRKKA